VCDFAVGIKEEAKISGTSWLDSDGELVKFHVKVNGTTEWTGPGGTAIISRPNFPRYARRSPKVGMCYRSCICGPLER
jgi:hypothetical protein